ncbi:MAG: patatin-like phospholipase family protein [Acidobacteriota bacterium]
MVAILRRPRVGLALGGGAARGLAHVGVLKVLEREGFPIDVVVGTSIGALVGGAFATLEGSAEVERRFLQFASSTEFRRKAFDFIREARQREPGMLGRATALIRRGIFYGYSLYRVSFMSAESLAHNINSLLPDVRIEETRLPYAAVAADLRTGQEIILASGPIRPIVAASCAIPGVLPPVTLYQRTLIDGGWVDRVPGLPVLRLGADVVIGVDISPEVGAHLPTRGVDVMVAATSVQAAALKKMQARFMDYVIQPDVAAIHWADFSAVGIAIEAGMKAAQAALPALWEIISRRRRWLSGPGGTARARARGQFEKLTVVLDGA